MLTAMVDPAAMELADELDGLPLALATAGAYLEETATTFSDYLRLYRESWLKLQKTSPELSSYEDRALYSTWQLSLNHIKQQNELSAKLLQLWAYFSNQDLWFELLRHGDSSDPEWIQRLTDELSFNEAVRVLCNHGLVEADMAEQDRVESPGYGMHSCVHWWTIHILNEEWDYSLAKLALKCIGSHVPRRDMGKWWITQRRLLQHAARCWHLVESGKIGDEGMEWALIRLGNMYLDQGKLNESEKIYQRVRQGFEKALGPDHTSTFVVVNNLGMLYRDQGKLDEAEKMLQRALQGHEKALGPDHTLTLQTVNSLGLLYADMGRLDEAEKMYQRALHGYEKALGPDHMSTLDTVHHLGLLYANLGKLDEAEKMLQRALQGYEKALGPEHTSTLNTVHNLGRLYQDQTKLVESEKMYQRVLQGFEKALGPDHTSTLLTVMSLGTLYRNQGKLDEATKMYQRALQGYEKALGPDHISTLEIVYGFGNVCADLGKLDEAEKMYQRALQGFKKALGSELITTYIPALNTTENLAILYTKMGRGDEARELYERALRGLESVFGRSSERCERTVADLAYLDANKS